MDYGMRLNEMEYGQWNENATISQSYSRLFYHSPAFTT